MYKIRILFVLSILALMFGVASSSTALADREHRALSEEVELVLESQQIELYVPLA